MQLRWMPAAVGLVALLPACWGRVLVDERSGCSGDEYSDDLLSYGPDAPARTPLGPTPGLPLEEEAAGRWGPLESPATITLWEGLFYGPPQCTLPEGDLTIAVWVAEECAELPAAPSWLTVASSSTSRERVNADLWRVRARLPRAVHGQGGESGWSAVRLTQASACVAAVGDGEDPSRAAWRMPGEDWHPLSEPPAGENGYSFDLGLGVAEDY